MYSKIGVKLGVKTRFFFPKGVIKFVIGGFSPKGVMKFVIRCFSLKGVMRFVKKRRGPKIGTMGEV